MKVFLTTEEQLNLAKQQYKENEKILLKINSDIQNCALEIMKVKMKVATLQIHMRAMKTMYHDLVELKKLIVELNLSLIKL